MCPKCQSNRVVKVSNWNGVYGYSCQICGWWIDLVPLVVQPMAQEFKGDKTFVEAGQKKRAMKGCIHCQRPIRTDNQSGYCKECLFRYGKKIKQEVRHEQK